MSIRPLGLANDPAAIANMLQYLRRYPRRRRSDRTDLVLDFGMPPTRRLALVLGSLLVSLLVTCFGTDHLFAGGLDPAPTRALFILLLAAMLWITEAVPAFAVGILVIGLEIVLLGDPAGPFATDRRDWEQFVGVIGSPLIWLFFGGFVLAAGTQKTGLDRWFAAAILGRLGSRPGAILAGVMGITFVLSMFLSNTATTAMMLALMAPVVAQFDTDEPFGKSLLLGIAVAANVGGMASLIGTPPNAIAVGALSQFAQRDVNFLQWMLLGLPLALVLTTIAWGFLMTVYRPSEANREICLELDADGALRHTTWWDLSFVILSLFLTIGLWLTAQWHHIPTAAVSFLPIVFLTSSGVLGQREIRSLQYDVLFLLAGGIALGNAVVATGLASAIVDNLPLDGLGLTGLALVLAYVTVAMSNVMSNTAAANILIPIAIAMAGAGAVQVAVPLALAASAAMCLPIATPPNALVYSEGRLATRDFLVLGLMIGVVTPAAAVAWVSLIMPQSS